MHEYVYMYVLLFKTIAKHPYEWDLTRQQFENSTHLPRLQTTLWSTENVSG